MLARDADKHWADGSLAGILMLLVAAEARQLRNDRFPARKRPGPAGVNQQLDDLT
jgi:hypothetical protein